MKKARIGIVIISIILVCAMAVNLSSCTTMIKATNLTKNITPNNVNTLTDFSQQNIAISDFAIRLFKASENSNENTLISPLSILCALAMTANGAEGETLNQIENMLGMTNQQLNLYLYSYIKKLPQGEKYKLNLANSIWFTNDKRFTVNRDFLQTAKDYYDADIYKAALNNQTCKDVNDWVNKKTGKMIPKILDRFSENAVMCLVNALAFDAEWDNIYEENSVSDGEFIKEDGTKQDASFMESTENLYLEDDKAKGFMKYYAGGKYAFVAMLPNNGVSISEYISLLNSDSLNTLLLNPQSTDVYTEIPKFETEYKVEMSKILKTMGIPKAFDKINAEFNALGTSTTGNIYIDEVLHKTYISVGEKGTRAAAATNVITDDFFYDMDIKEVCLNRPFVYMLIDCENNIPFFIGTMMDVKN